MKAQNIIGENQEKINLSIFISTMGMASHKRGTVSGMGKTSVQA